MGFDIFETLLGLSCQNFAIMHYIMAKSNFFNFIVVFIVNGYSILDNMDNIRKQIGLCQ
jgi:hypothetical protein